MHEVMLPQHHLVGWMMIVSADRDLTAKIDAGLQGFVGDYGLTKTTIGQDGFTLGFWEPADFFPLTTWSLFQDDRTLCFVEGSFYDTYCGYWPQQGHDPVLAQLLSTDYRRMSGRALARLSGSFSGCIVDYDTRQLVTFVDRLATKPLYWTQERDDLLVSSNLAAFRALKTLEIDLASAFQFLTVGFPIGTRTLLKDVRIHPPAHMQVFEGCRHQSLQYWEAPVRHTTLTVRKSAERIAAVVEECMRRIYRAANCTLGLGLTGGHDSRVLLSALVTQAIPFVPIRWDEGNANDTLARGLCATIGKELELASGIATCDELETIRDDVFVYTDGMYRYISGFPRLGRACLERRIGCLVLGFTGDVISGGLTMPSPHYLKTIHQLAQQAWRNQMERLSFDAALSVLAPATTSIRESTQDEWEQSFVEEATHGHLVDIAIWQRLANRNLKRIRFSMLPVSKYVQAVFPYLDNAVLDTYFSLPIKALQGQHAHCYASFGRIHAFGRFPVSGSPIPLRVETLFPATLHRVRVWQLRVKDALAPFRPRQVAIDWAGEYRMMYDEIALCPLFNGAVLKTWRDEQRLMPKDLRYLHMLSRAYAFFVDRTDQVLTL